MRLTINLPDHLPEDDFELEIHFERIPPESCLIRATLNPDMGGDDALEFAIYGRGIGSNATERVVKPLRLDSRYVQQHRRSTGNRLVLEVNDLLDRSIQKQGFLQIRDFKIHRLNLA